jgi:beta-phosphoglucomutase-like phosphatase (HAD superfamily)
MLQIPARHVLFDIDGVLIDNAWVIAGCQAEALAGIGIELPLNEVRRRYGGLSPAAMAGPVAAELGQPLPNGWVAQLEEAMGQWLKNNARAVMNAAETVSRLQAKGVRTTAVSRWPLDQITVPLGMAGLLGLFTPRLYSAAMLDRDDHHPGLFDLASRQSGIVRNQTALVTSAPDAVAAGIATDLAVFGLAADPDVDAEALKRAGAMLFYDLRALPKLLRLV